MRGRRAGAIAGRIAPGPKGRGAAFRGVIAGCCAIGLLHLTLDTASAQPLAIEEGALGDVFQVLDAPGATEAPVVVQTDAGYVRFLGAPPGGRFLARDTGNKSAGVAGVAQTFIGDHAEAFGAVSTSTSFQAGPVRRHNGYDFVHLDQYYGDLPVFGAQVVVQVDPSSAITTVMSDIMRDTRVLDDGSISLTPTISSGQALAYAAASLAADTGVDARNLRGQGSASLEVFRPSVVGLSGQTRLVWRLRVISAGDVDSVVLVDAHTGQIALKYSLLEHALDRQIFDANGAVLIPDLATRSEGGASTEIPAVDDVYDFLGDTYNFFLNEHGHDSFDGNGSPIVATVNVPFLNACWGCSLTPGSTEEGSGDVTEMLFGTGLVLDDVVAHEFTHGVTQFTSGLIYFGYAGAINESLSDMWGEWIDQTNGSDNDTPENAWVVGEELDSSIAFLLSGELDGYGIRNMKDPTLFGHADRLATSPFLADATSFLDNGGVHSNSGIGNKLAYLVTAGDTFNGQTIEGLGISLAADLFFGTQFLLPPSADYTDLYLAMGQSAKDLGLTFEERLNLANAGRAVEIVPASLFENGLRDFRALSTADASGNPVIALTWTNPAAGTFEDIRLLRSPTRFPQSLNEGEVLTDNVVQQYLDRDVTAGETYFYSVIANLENGLPQVVSAFATAGEFSGDALTEFFGGGADFTNAEITDLSFSQLVFTPVGRPSGGLGSFNNYEVTFHPNAFELPVPRQDSEGTAFDITAPQDSGVLIDLGSTPVPFFGQPYSQLFAAANGYISFQGISRDDPLNFPSLDSHFAIPRLSYLFAGAGILDDTLAASAGGSMWFRSLDDRVVLTYENVPQFNAFAPSAVGSTSTVQVEMYFSGRIRITYLDAVATSAIVGLSDGRGEPVDPATIFPGVMSVGGLTDFSELPSEQTRLSIEPVTPPLGAAGSVIRYNVATFVPPGSGLVPTLTATWDGPGAVPFADNGDGTGTFNWNTRASDDGTFMVRVTAMAGGEVAFQDTVVQVGFAPVLPLAVGLALATDETGEDPTQDRAVPDETSLHAVYSYSHPDATGGTGFFDEGQSVVYWYRNDQVITSFTNRLQISPQATRGGDVWYFGVVPVSVSGISGPIAYSPRVTISGIPEIVSVSPAIGSVLGGETVRISGSRLSAPISVTFGGVAATSIRAAGSGEIEVTTPLHAAGTVDVVVNTVDGPGILVDGYTYLGDGTQVQVTDVNNDGKINALDVQLVVNAVLRLQAKSSDINPDANRDGQVNASDIQVVVNEALHR